MRRIATLERGVLDRETGEFPMVLATEGEAADGHILGIKGLEVPDRMPMLFRHSSETTIPVLGSIVSPAKGRKDGVPVLRARGRFNLNGDDPLADIRRGIAQLVEDGDLTGVSLSWDTLEATRRVDLPKGHKAHVPAEEDSMRRWGYWISQARAREGSVVALGADTEALVGRSDHAESEFGARFFRVLAESEPGSDGLRDLDRALSLLGEGRARVGSDATPDDGVPVLFDALSQRVVVAQGEDLLSVDAREALCATLCTRAACQCDREGAEMRHPDEDPAEMRDREGAEMRREPADEPVKPQPPRESPEPQRRTIANLSERDFQRMLGASLRGPLAEFAEALTGRRS